MQLEKHVLATLAYHDIFDYPLSFEETHKFLIQKSSKKQLEIAFTYLIQKKLIGQNKALYFLAERQNIVSIRKKRGGASEKKLRKAGFYANLLRMIPSIKMVAVSGALAMENSDKKDDIDFVIIASSGLLWTTRFFSNILLWPFKRDPQSQKKSDRACLNLFLDESALEIKNRNLYIAHELAQMKPLWDRNKTYNKLIKANSWIKEYLPNWQTSSQFTAYGVPVVKISSQKRKPSIINYQLSAIEHLLKIFQLWYMKEKITTEKIGEKQLFFHPRETQDKVLKRYKVACNPLLKKL